MDQGSSIGRIRCAARLAKNRSEQRRRVGAAAGHLVEERQLERGIPALVPRGQRFEQPLRILVLSAVHGESRQHDRSRRIGCAARRGHPLGVGALAMRQRRSRRTREIG